MHQVVNAPTIESVPAVSEPEPAGSAPSSRAVIGGGALVTAAMVVSGAGNYALNAVLARWLSPEEFGDASLLVTLLLVVTAVAGCFQLVAARYTSEAIGEGDPTAVMVLRSRLVRTAWLVGGLLGLATALGAGLLADLFNIDEPVVLVIFGSGIPLFLAQAVDRGVLQGRFAFRGLASSFLVEMAVRVGASCGLVAAGWGLIGISTALTASLLASLLVARTLVRPVAVARTQRRIPTLRHAAGATSSLLVAQIVIGHGDLLLVKQGFAAADAGTYAVVALLGRAVFLGSWSVVTAVFPVGARVKTDARAIRRLVRGGLSLLVAGGVLATVVFWAFADPIVRLLFSERYAGAASLLGPYVLATSLLAVANFLAMVDLAAGRHRRARLMMGAAGLQSLLVAASGSLSSVVWAQVITMALLTAAMLVTPGGPGGSGGSR